MGTLGKKADDVGIAADELVASDDTSGTKATAVARAVSQLLGEASKSGASTHVLQSAMNVADTAGKVIAAKRAKSDNVAALNDSLKGDIRALHDALKEEPTKIPGPTAPGKPRKKDKPEEPKPATADSTKKDKAVKKEKKDKAKKAKEQKRVEEVVEQVEVVKEETRTIAADPTQPSTEDEFLEDAPVDYEPEYNDYPPEQPAEAVESLPVVQEDYSQYSQFGQFPAIHQIAYEVDPNLPTEHIQGAAESYGTYGGTYSGAYGGATYGYGGASYIETAAPVQEYYQPQARFAPALPPRPFRPPPPPAPLFPPLLPPLLPTFYTLPLIPLPVPLPYDGRNFAYDSEYTDW